MTNIECVQKIIEEMRPNEDFENYLLFIEDRPGHDRRYAIDFQSIIGFDCNQLVWYWVKNQLNSKNFIEWEEKHY